MTRSSIWSGKGATVGLLLPHTSSLVRKARRADRRESGSAEGHPWVWVFCEAS